MSEQWPVWASVRGAIPNFDEPAGDHPEFVTAMLPFAEHPAFLQADPGTRRTIHALGWLLFNERITRVEMEIVTPLCQLAVAGRLPGARASEHRIAFAQTLVDEAWHVALLARACEATRRRCGITGPPIRHARIVDAMRGFVASYGAEADRDLARLACGVAIETTIGEAMVLVATDPAIHPLNRLVTEIHRRDEACHATLFRDLARSVYAELDTAGRARLEDLLALAQRCFVGGELEGWREVLSQAGALHADAMLDACSASIAEEVATWEPDGRAFAASLGLR